MDTIVTRAPNSPHRSWRTYALVIAVVAVVAAGFVAVNGLVRDPDVVARVQIRNETSDLVEVLVRGDAGSDLLPVAVIEPGRSASAYDVVDQGDRWTFVVRTSGRTVAQLRYTRDELEQAGWRVVIPGSAEISAGG